MIVDAIDNSGRRYMASKNQYFTELCVECGRTIEIGEEYYMRNDATDGAQIVKLIAALMELTYDSVCQTCGERQLRIDAT